MPSSFWRFGPSSLTPHGAGDLQPGERLPFDVRHAHEFDRRRPLLDLLHVGEFGDAAADAFQVCPCFTRPVGKQAGYHVRG